MALQITKNNDITIAVLLNNTVGERLASTLVILIPGY